MDREMETETEMVKDREIARETHRQTDRQIDIDIPSTAKLLNEVVAPRLTVDAV
jgi:hypothetical protein